MPHLSLVTTATDPMATTALGAQAAATAGPPTH